MSPDEGSIIYPSSGEIQAADFETGLSSGVDKSVDKLRWLA
jgi:hypothetical protein